MVWLLGSTPSFYIYCIRQYVGIYTRTSYLHVCLDAYLTAIFM